MNEEVLVAGHQNVVGASVHQSFQGGASSNSTNFTGCTTIERTNIDGLIEPLHVSSIEQNEYNEQRQLSSAPVDHCTLIPALLSASPSIIYTCFKMKFASLPYFLLLFSSIPVAIRLQDINSRIRWLVGFIVVAIMSGIKTAMLMTVFQNQSILIKGLFYAHTALWECSNCSLIFGGRTALEKKFNIDSYSKGIVAALCPSQVRFVTTANCASNSTLQGHDSNILWNKWKQNSIHLSYYAIAFVAFCFGLKAIVPDEIPIQYAILEAEGIVLYIATLVNIWNVPVHLYQLMMLLFNNRRSASASASASASTLSNTISQVQVIYPYGAIYFSKSSREFWSRWSRPASSMIRYMFYYPLGGSARAWLSVPIMFLLNASSHYTVSESIMGDRSEKGWNAVFGILGVAATFEVLGNKFVTSRIVDEEGMSIENEPKWWNWIKFIVAATSLRFAAYWLVHGCFDSTLADLL